MGGPLDGFFIPSTVAYRVGNHHRGCRHIVVFHVSLRHLHDVGRVVDDNRCCTANLQEVRDNRGRDDTKKKYGKYAKVNTLASLNSHSPRRAKAKHTHTHTATKFNFHNTTNRVYMVSLVSERAAATFDQDELVSNLQDKPKQQRP